MRVLLIDFESTGLDTSKDRIIEIGAQIVDDQWELLASVSTLVNGPDIESPSNEIQGITGITLEEWKTHGVHLKDALDLLLLTLDADVVFAYNKDFDFPLFRTEMFRHGLGLHAVGNHFLQIPWVCAMRDVESNYQKKCWKLSHLALDYGISVDPSRLHRAIDDVDLMRRMLKAAGSSPQEIFNFSIQPWIIVRALVPPPWEDAGKGKDIVRKLGYSWQEPKGTSLFFEKSWVKRIKESWLDEEIKKVPYPIRQIKES